jgi:hypothetical protein
MSVTILIVAVLSASYKSFSDQTRPQGEQCVYNNELTHDTSVSHPPKPHQTVYPSTPLKPLHTRVFIYLDTHMLCRVY